MKESKVQQSLRDYKNKDTFVDRKMIDALAPVSCPLNNNSQEQNVKAIDQEINPSRIISVMD